MRNTTRTLRLTFAAFLVAAALAFLPKLPQAAALPIGAGAQAQDADLAGTAAASHLDKKQFSNVKVTVDNGVATLTGSVDLYVYKADAAKRVMHAKGVVAVRNQIEVGGTSIPDKELQEKLAEKLEYDRVGFGNVFDAIGVGVDHGVVTLAGHAHNYVNRDSAIALASTMPGVKDLVDNIEVDPVSLMDDQSRVAVARAIYSFPTLNKYAINPGMPIRVSVQNGHVELYGMVDSQADKDAAYIRANGVAGVFSVKNYIQVANQTNETSKR
jgi:osmotically-inducible protein OsmY